MRHIYECSNESTTYHEVYKTTLDDFGLAIWQRGGGWRTLREMSGDYIRTLENQNELDFYLDFLRELGVDFVIHTRKEYDEYHLALSAL